MSNDYNYDKLNVTELRKIIADLAKDRQQVASDKKDYVTSANEVLKENKERTDAAVDALRIAERTDTSKTLDKVADKMLRTNKPLQIQDVVLEKN
jgi:hypothetical protein